MPSLGSCSFPLQDARGPVIGLSSLLRGQWTGKSVQFPTVDAPLTAHHQQQDDQQRGHEHQQGQPDVVPHLGGWGRPAQSDAAVGAGGRAGGASRVSAAGAGRGGAPGRHGRRSPPRQRPQGAGRREAGAVADSADRPSFLPQPTERGRRRAARLPYPLIAPGSRGHGARRPRQRPDTLPWRTPRACGQERGRAQGRAATTRPSSLPARVLFCPHGLQVTSPGSRCSCFSVLGPHPLQQLITDSLHRLPGPPRRGGSWEMES
ncbi:dapper homolog 3-like [Pteropus medius]|uniref:dapper homolog 3-like n=1 Tax=Pteropus vampyrus TaxID=132908 RepID=UPI00196BA565|nr:dapper homolog 3-like [Pteropus giganteus]